MIKNVKQFLFIAALLIIAAGAQPAQTAFWQWSTTAASNATADPAINWAEGMSPSSVNDSARAMMSVLAKWRDDVSGGITTSGTTSAITATSNSGFSGSIPNNTRIVFLHNLAGNAAGATLNVDAVGAFPIYENGSPITSDRLQQGGIYAATFYTSTNRWYLNAIYNSPSSVPLGAVVYTTIATAPNTAFLSANGQCVSQSTYSVYYAALGSPGQGICPSGFFQLLDLRGRYIASLDTLPGSGAASRMTSSSNGCGTSFTTMGAVCASGAESKTLSAAQIPTITSSVSVSVSATGAATLPVRQGGSSGVQINDAVQIAYSNLPSVGNIGPVVSVSGSGSGSATSNNTSSGAHSVIPPTMGLYPWIRVL